MALTYSHFDRMIIGGICPVDPLPLEAGKELGTDYFLERREMGIINVGPPGKVNVDGRDFELDKTDGLYVGKNAREVVFTSLDPENPSLSFRAPAAVFQKPQLLHVCAQFAR